MKHKIVGALVGTALLAFASIAGAEELTVNSILAAQHAGAPVNGIIAIVNSPANTIAMTARDIVTLRDAGVPETVISAIWVRMPALSTESTPQRPDDVRLVELVRLINSGVSDSNIAEQVRQSGQRYNLSVNDLLYLKQNGAQESTIAALMSTHAGAPPALAVAPSEMVFNDLVLVKKTGLWRFFRKNREGSLALRGDTLTWEDKGNANENFTFQTSGLQKVWFTCEARSSGNFCYQINFQVVKGDRYRFRDIHKDSGSNTAVEKVMEALRTYLPRLPFGTPSIDD